MMVILPVVVLVGVKNLLNFAPNLTEKFRKLYKYLSMNVRVF